MSIRFQELYNSKSLLDAVCPRLVGFLSDRNAPFSLLLDCEAKKTNGYHEASKAVFCGKMV